MLRLQFVELNGNKKEIQSIENKPTQTIGHSGDLKPLISNGHISKVHCTIIYNESANDWTIIDGDLPSEKLSKNGIYSSEGEKICCRVTLDKFGDRIYLLKLDEVQAYIEIVDDDKTMVQPEEHQTSGLEIQLAEIQTKTDNIQVKAEETINKIVSVEDNVKINQEKIQELSKVNAELKERLEIFSSTLERIGKTPKVYLSGGLVAFFLGVLALISWGIYSNMDLIFLRYFQSPQSPTQQNQKK